jgi:hypothetical protein
MRHINRILSDWLEIAKDITILETEPDYKPFADIVSLNLEDQLSDVQSGVIILFEHLPQSVTHFQNSNTDYVFDDIVGVHVFSTKGFAHEENRQTVSDVTDKLIKGVLNHNPMIDGIGNARLRMHYIQNTEGANYLFLGAFRAYIEFEIKTKESY